MYPISVVVISFSKINRLETCLNTVRNALTENDELIIVDNTVSRDGVPDSKLREYLYHFESTSNGIPVRLHLNDWNMMFTAGANIGINLSKNPYIFLVNNDIEIIDPNTFQKLCEVSASDPKVATVTPVTVQSNGRVYCSGAFGAGNHKRDMPSKTRETEWNNFAFVCLKKELIERHGMLYNGNCTLGKRQVNCGHWHSDEEYCRRLTQLGYKHVVHPVVVKHFHMEGDEDGKRKYDSKRK